MISLVTNLGTTHINVKREIWNVEISLASVLGKSFNDGAKEAVGQRLRDIREPPAWSVRDGELAGSTRSVAVRPVASGGLLPTL